MEEVITQIMTFLIEVLALLKWPILVLILFLLLRKPLINLINRVTKVGYGDKSLEATQQSATVKIEKQEVSKVDRAIGSFEPETIETFNILVENETDFLELDTDGDKIKTLKNYSTILYIMLYFDTVYNAIFGSQIRLLERLNTLQLESKESLKFFYDNAEKQNPSFFENYSYEAYLSFLFSFTLIREDGNAIRITILGSDFLKYIIATNKNVNKLN